MNPDFVNQIWEVKNQKALNCEVISLFAEIYIDNGWMDLVFAPTRKNILLMSLLECQTSSVI